MPEHVEISFEIPEGIDLDLSREHLPMIASNLLVASETIKSRMLQEKGSYSEKDVLKLVFDNWGFWMDTLARSADAQK